MTPAWCLGCDPSTGLGGALLSTGGVGRDLVGARPCRPRRSVVRPAPAVNVVHPRQKGLATPLALPDCSVTVGVDSHGEVHVAAALDQLGRLLATTTVPTTTTRGYASCSPGPASWARSNASAWKAPAPTRQGCCAFCTPTARSSSRSTARPVDPAPPRQVRPHRRRGGRPRGALAGRAGATQVS
jgi:hypothetical protein